MQLEAGSRLGHYEILDLAGKGGMGEVYRARDTKLNREVAIKILPEAFTSDPERLLRFDREAHLLAALNHPHIASIYGLEEINGEKFLVMELAAGETLADRISRGAIATEEVLHIAQQIAEALEAAHEKGIIHRDLKPANIKIDEEGRVKVLDFGLAKALESDEDAQDLSNSPTMLKASHTGVILGTAAYMSPEQARGKRVDKRTDVWSFGVVLWEMLTRHRPFAGETVTDTLAAIITQEPEWNSLPASTPVAVRRLLQRCLVKRSRDRLHDIADARLEISEAMHPLSPTETQPHHALKERRPRPSWLASLLLVLIGGIAGVFAHRALTPGTITPTIRSSIGLPAGTQLAGWASPPVAISPDGSVIAFVAIRGTKQELYLRHIDEFEARLVEGSDGAEGPFFSPDGQWVAFAAGSVSGRSTDPPALKKVSTGGGPAQIITAVGDYFGGSWHEDGFIYYSGSYSEGLWRVPASGGTAERLRRDNQQPVMWPQVVSGGAALVIAPDDQGVLHVAIADLRNGKVTLSDVQATFARLVEGSVLLYIRKDGVLLAAPFSLKRRALDGTSIPIISDVAISANGGAVFALSKSGSVIYTQGFVRGSGRELRRVSLLDFQGKLTPLPLPADTITSLRLSPDRTRIAFTTWDGGMNLYDLQRKTRMKLPTGNVQEKNGPVWTPDGNNIAYHGELKSVAPMFIQRADGSDTPRALVSARQGEFWPSSFSPDASWLAYYTFESTPNQRDWEVWLMPMDNPSGAKRLATGYNPQISPDGRWIAYESSESGRWEIYMQSFPPPGRRILISTGGGKGATWSPDSRRLYYWQENTLMTVDVGMEVGIPAAMFEADELDIASSRRVASMGAVSDGFIVVAPVAGSGVQTDLKLATGWMDEVRQKLAAEDR